VEKELIERGEEERWPQGGGRGIDVWDRVDEMLRVVRLRGHHRHLAHVAVGRRHHLFHVTNRTVKA
jgi:hypothetical protein